MNARTKILLPLALPALWAFSAPADEVAFRPEAGLTLTKSFNSTVELSLDEMRMTMNGEEQDASMLGMEMTMTNVTELEFSDTYVRMADGQPGQLERVYESLGNTTSTSQSNQFTGSMDMDIPSSSELEGETVLFTWDADEEAYVASYPEDADGDEELLEGLEEDADLRGFLPADAVSEGDTWEIDPDYLVHLMAPGGDLKLLPEDVEGMGPMGDPTSELGFQEMLGDIEGEVACEYKGTEDGMAVIAVTMEITSTNDLTDMIREQMAGADLPAEAGDIDFTAMDVEMAIEGEGTLLWNARAGHFASFEFSADMEQVMDMGMSMSGPFGDMEMEHTITMSGNLTFAFEADEE